MFDVLPKLVVAPDPASTFFIRLEKTDDDFLAVSSTFNFFVADEFDWEGTSNSRFDDEGLSLVVVLLWGVSFRSFTDLFQALLIALTRSTIAGLLGESTQIRCFSIDPMAFPKPLSFTTDFVTGNSAILVNK